MFIQGSVTRDRSVRKNSRMDTEEPLSVKNLLGVFRAERKERVCAQRVGMQADPEQGEWREQQGVFLI